MIMKVLGEATGLAILAGCVYVVLLAVAALRKYVRGK